MAHQAQPRGLRSSFRNIVCVWSLIAVLATACDCSLLAGNSTSPAAQQNRSLSAVPLVAASSNLHGETEKETVIDEKQNSIEKSGNIALGHPFGLGAFGGFGGFGGLKTNQLLTLLLLTGGGGKLANNQLLTLLLLLGGTGGHFHGAHWPLALGKFAGLGGKHGINPLLALGLTGGLNTFGLGLGGYNPLLLLLLAQAFNKKDDKDDKAYHLNHHPDYYKMPLSQLETPVHYYHSDSKSDDHHLLSAVHLPNHYKDQHYPADTYQVNHYSSHGPLKQQIVNTDLLAKLVQTTTSSPKSKPISKASAKSAKLKSAQLLRFD